MIRMRRSVLRTMIRLRQADVVKETSEKDANSPAESPGYKSRDQQSVEYHEREAKRREKSMAKVNKLKATAGGK